MACSAYDQNIGRASAGGVASPAVAYSAHEIDQSFERQQ
jgi:hypothetical protein